MKKLITIILLSFNLISYSQKIDTIITTTIYKSYFSYTLHEPLFVVYKLYQGGGDCKRDTMEFKTGGLKQSSTSKDYLYSGYHKGHMANAEDFASDCIKEEMTFRYFNTLPQSPKSNRGSWKSLETKVRKQSQKDSLLIICGGYEYEQDGTLYVPKYCYKIIKNLNTKEIKAYLFNNDESNKFEEEDFNTFVSNLPNSNKIIKIINK